MPVTLVLSMVLMAALFLMIFAVVALVQAGGFLNLRQRIYRQRL